MEAVSLLYSDSILVKVGNKVIKSFLERDDYTSLGWLDSTYNEENCAIISPEEMPPDEIVSSSDNAFLFYYSLDTY